MNRNFNSKVLKKMRFRRLSVQTYKSFLKKWSVNNDILSDESSVHQICGQLECSQKLKENINNENLKQNDKTIDLNDSLDSIPETPEFVEKRKPLKRKEIKSKKRLISKFIDFESEVVMDSKDSYSDDIEDTQKELVDSSQTIIDDTLLMDTQPIGQLFGGIDSRTADDMQEVYMRSVKDLIIGNSDKYKLQYNYDTNINVFSQEPNDSELEDYEFDSFCVPNDSIEFVDSSPQKITNSIDFTTESPVPKSTKKVQKRYKRIIFSP